LHYRFHVAAAALNLTKDQEELLYTRLHLEAIAGFDNYLAEMVSEGKAADTPLVDISEPARLVKLAKLHPELLTYQEQIILKAIYDVGFVDFSDKARTKSYAFCANGKPILANIEACWDELVKFADGQIGQHELKDAMAEKLKQPVTGRRDLDPLEILGRRHG
jgi:hypothetical protein